MVKRRIESKTSRTAEWTCLSRAISFLESNHYFRSDDHIALLLVPRPLQILLSIALIRRFISRTITPKGIYAYTIARTKYIDAVFKGVLADGFDQILIFGAGFDSRALRFQNEAGDIRIFELDVAITQEAKLNQYAKRGLSIPENVRFISIDFDKDSLSDKLEGGGFRGDMRSIFLLEGLLMYLQPESVVETFKVIKKYAGEGSIVLFDYVRSSVLRQAGLCYGENKILESVAKAGEQWHFGFEEGELDSFLGTYGFRVIEHKNAQDLEQMYFTDRSGKVLTRVNDTHCLVRAEKLSEG